MKTTRRLMIMVVALALPLAMATTASGAPDCTDPKFADNPACTDPDPDPQEPPAGGTVCDPAAYPADIDGVQYDDFTFTLSSEKVSMTTVCIDVVSDEGPWSVTITGEGAKYLVIWPRDSAGAGDSCGGYRLRGSGQIYGSNPLVLGGDDGVVPAATINACGVEFAEWVDLDTPGLDPELCADFDGAGQCLVTEQVDVIHPLALLVSLQGRGSTTFEVDLP